MKEKTNQPTMAAEKYTAPQIEIINIRFSKEIFGSAGSSDTPGEGMW